VCLRYCMLSNVSHSTPLAQEFASEAVQIAYSCLQLGAPLGGDRQWLGSCRSASALAFRVAVSVDGRLRAVAALPPVRGGCAAHGSPPTAVRTPTCGPTGQPYWLAFSGL
jgi:hypothetical protein